MTTSTTILALDPATSTGYCLVSVNVDSLGYWTDADIFEYGFIGVNIDSNYQGDHCIDLMTKVQNIIDSHSVGYIIIEDFFYSKRFANGCNVNGAFRTAIHILARQNDIEYTILNIPAWKTFIAGSSRTTKEQKKKWGVEASKKIYIQEALWNNFGIRFPNHSLSEKTGKPICFRYDIVDVVAQAIYYCCQIGWVPTSAIGCSVDVPEDVIIKRSTKKQYQY